MSYPNPMVEPSMKVDEFAREAQVTQKHVRDLFHEGKLTGCQLGRAIRLNRAEAYKVLGITPDMYDEDKEAEE